MKYKKRLGDTENWHLKLGENIMIIAMFQMKALKTFEKNGVMVTIFGILKTNDDIAKETKMWKIMNN
jgi:hypothetical protein